MTPRITVIGLGPAGAGFLTAEAVVALGETTPLYLRTSRHPGGADLVAAGAITLDHHYESAASFADTYAGIVEELVEAAARAGEVRYAVPGSPMVLETTVALLRADPRVEVRIVGGLSFLDLAWERLGIDPVSAGVRLVDAERFATDAAGERGPLLIAQTWSSALLSEVKIAFEEPPTSHVVLLHHLGLPDEVVAEVPFFELDRSLVPDHLTCCYLPELAAPVAAELARAAAVVGELRLACPWDSEQTHQSLVRHLLEESYEAIEAIEGLGEEPDAQQIAHLEEELGDVLCQVLFHAAIASEEGWFNLADVARALADKLVRRHPHVYGEGSVRLDAEGVLAGWEAAKREEKGRTSLLEGIPPALPALAYAAKLERRMSEIGLRASEDDALGQRLAGALAALRAGEVDGAGELLLGIARSIAALGAEPEELLRQASAGLRTRFLAAEAASRRSGEPLRPSAELRAEIAGAGEPLER